MMERHRANVCCKLSADSLMISANTVSCMISWLNVGPESQMVDRHRASVCYNSGGQHHCLLSPVVVVNHCFTSLFGTKGLLSDIIIR